jgi:hypothetical protein
MKSKIKKYHPLGACGTDTNPKVSRASFTPGPWKVHKSDHANTGLLIEQHGGNVVAECDPVDNMVANARLIAAAPELVEAVAFATEEIDDILHDPTTTLDGIIFDQLAEMLPVLRRALKKAGKEVVNE